MTIFVLIMWLYVPADDAPRIEPPREFSTSEKCLVAGREFEAAHTERWLWFCIERRSLSRQDTGS